MKTTAFPLRPISELVDRVIKPVDVDASVMYEQIGVRSHGKGLFYKEPVTGASLGSKRVFWVEPECLVINIVFAWEQAVARTRETERSKIASHRFPMFRPRKTQADLDYLNYLFKTEYGKYLLGLASPGGAGRNKTLGQSEFMRIKIPCPPVAEQKRIVEILSAWDAAIETTGKLIAAEKLLRTEITRAILSGDRRLPRFSGAWKQAQLGQLGSFTKGRGISRSQVSSRGFPCVRYGEIYTEHDFIIRSFSSFVSPLDAAESLRLSRGDILFAVSGETAEEIGKCVAFVDDIEAYAGSDIVVFSGHRQSPRFLAYLLNSDSVVSQKRRYGQGNSVVHISATNLARLSFELPPLKEQEAIADVMEALDKTLIMREAIYSRLMIERQALVQQLLTGQRRVGKMGVAA